MSRTHLISDEHTTHPRPGPDAIAQDFACTTDSSCVAAGCRFVYTAMGWLARLQEFMQRPITVTGGGLLVAAAAAALGTVVVWKTGLGDYALGEFGAALSRATGRRRKANRPKFIILVRHGQSQGNVDPNIYSHVPDSKLRLTPKGRAQAVEAGRCLKRLLGDANVLFFVSPFLRANETLAGMLKSFPDRSRYRIRVDPRLREQEFGNLQDPHQMQQVFKQRRKFGRFFWRFQDGESGADVYGRVTAFWDTLYRQMDNFNRKKRDAFVIVSHGLTMRLFLMRYFRWSVAYFETVQNPHNAEVWVLKRNAKGSYDLATTIRTASRSSTSTFGDLPGSKHVGRPLRDHGGTARSTPRVVQLPTLGGFRATADHETGQAADVDSQGEGTPRIRLGSRSSDFRTRAGSDSSAEPSASSPASSSTDRIILSLPARARRRGDSTASRKLSGQQARSFSPAAASSSPAEARPAPTEEARTSVARGGSTVPDLDDDSALDDDDDDGDEYADDDDDDGDDGMDDDGDE